MTESHGVDLGFFTNSDPTPNITPAEIPVGNTHPGPEACVAIDSHRVGASRGCLRASPSDLGFQLTPQTLPTSPMSVSATRLMPKGRFRRLAAGLGERVDGRVTWGGLGPFRKL